MKRIDIKEKKKTTILTILLVIALIVIIFLGVIIFKFNNESKNNNNSNNNKLTTTTKNITNEPTEEELRKIISEFLIIDGKGHTDSILNYLNIGYDESKEVYDEKSDLIITNVKYDDFKNKMLNYMTKDYFNKEYGDKYIKDENGYIRKGQGGGEYPEYKINKITKIKDLSYTVDVTATDYNDKSINEIYEFTFKKYNNKLVVDTYKERN